MTAKTPRPEVPVLDDIVEHGARRPPNHDLFAAGSAIDPAALRLALQKELHAWLDAALPAILATLEQEARAALTQQLADALPELLDRTLKKL